MLAAAGSAPGQQRRDFGGARPQPRAASPAGSRSLPPAAAAAMATRSCREKAQKQNEQHQAILAKLLREEDNKYCADCEAKGTGGRGAGVERRGLGRRRRPRPVPLLRPAALPRWGPDAAPRRSSVSAASSCPAGTERSEPRPGGGCPGLGRREGLPSCYLCSVRRLRAALEEVRVCGCVCFGLCGSDVDKMWHVPLSFRIASWRCYSVWDDCTVIYCSKYNTSCVTARCAQRPAPAQRCWGEAERPRAAAEPPWQAAALPTEGTRAVPCVMVVFNTSERKKPDLILLLYGRKYYIMWITLKITDPCDLQVSLLTSLLVQLSQLLVTMLETHCNPGGSRRVMLVCFVHDWHSHVELLAESHTCAVSCTGLRACLLKSSVSNSPTQFCLLF